MPRGRTANDPATLAMALVGYELERQRIDQKISEIRAQLGGRDSGAAGAAVRRWRKQSGTKRKPLSMAARKRIAAAQRRRWAEHRKKTAQSAKSE